MRCSGVRFPPNSTELWKTNKNIVCCNYDAVTDLGFFNKFIAEVRACGSIGSITRVGEVGGLVAGDVGDVARTRLRQGAVQFVRRHCSVRVGVCTAQFGAVLAPRDIASRGVICLYM